MSYTPCCIAALALLGATAGCALPGPLNLAARGGPPIADTTVRHGSVGVSVRAYDRWLEVLVINSGESPVDVALGDATYFSPDLRSHSLAGDVQVDAYIGGSQRALLRPAWYEGGPTQARPVRRLIHTAPPELTAAPAWRVPPDRAYEWRLYPAEHVRMDDDGLPALDSLLCGHHAGASPYIALVVPIRIDGEWQSVTVQARVRPGP